MKVAFKVWLDSDGKAFGEGPYKLLQLVEKTGSLHKAAMEIGMSYRKAWNMINRAEKRLDIIFLVKKVGGASGGGSKVTDEGRAFMKNYELFCTEINEMVENIYNKHFGFMKKTE